MRENSVGCMRNNLSLGETLNTAATIRQHSDRQRRHPWEYRLSGCGGASRRRAVQGLPNQILMYNCVHSGSGARRLIFRIRRCIPLARLIDTPVSSDS